MPFPLERVCLIVITHIYVDWRWIRRVKIARAIVIVDESHLDQGPSRASLCPSPSGRLNAEQFILSPSHPTKDSIGNLSLSFADQGCTAFKNKGATSLKDKSSATLVEVLMA